MSYQIAKVSLNYRKKMNINISLQKTVVSLKWVTPTFDKFTSNYNTSFLKFCSGKKKKNNQIIFH